MFFFGAWVYITPEPIDIDTSNVILDTPEVLDIVNSGAHLRIDVTANVKSKTVLEARADVKSKYPNGCVIARLISEDSTEYNFKEQGVSYSKDDVHLTLYYGPGLNKDLKFNRVIIQSCYPIKDAKVIWKNFSQ